MLQEIEMNPIEKQENIEVELRCHAKIVAAQIVRELIQALKVRPL
jgi:hypothetical protein